MAVLCPHWALSCPNRGFRQGGVHRARAGDLRLQSRHVSDDQQWRPGGQPEHLRGHLLQAVTPAAPRPTPTPPPADLCLGEPQQLGGAMADPTCGGGLYGTLHCYVDPILDPKEPRRGWGHHGEHPHSVLGNVSLRGVHPDVPADVPAVLPARWQRLRVNIKESKNIKPPDPDLLPCHLGVGQLCRHPLAP